MTFFYVTEKTRNVDVTITNLVEGKVEYTSIEPDQSAESKSSRVVSMNVMSFCRRGKLWGMIVTRWTSLSHIGLHGHVLDKLVNSRQVLHSYVVQVSRMLDKLVTYMAG